MFIIYLIINFIAGLMLAIMIGIKALIPQHKDDEVDLIKWKQENCDNSTK